MRPSVREYRCSKRRLSLRPEIVEFVRFLLTIAGTMLVSAWVGWQIWATGWWL